MRKVLMNLIGIAIVILLVVGFKSYVLYYYEPVTVDVRIGSKVKIEKDDKIKNHKLEALSYFLDDKFITKDNGETYTIEQSKEEQKEDSSLNAEDEVENIQKEITSGTITFEIKHKVIENISVEDKKLQKVDYIPFMQYSNLKNEVDLVNYYIKEKEKDSSILDLIYQIGTKYLSSIFVQEMGLDKEIKEFDGLDGYLVKNGTNTKAIVFYQGSSYEVTFSEEFAEDDIVEILNTFEFQ